MCGGVNISSAQVLTVNLMRWTVIADLNEEFKESKCQLLPSGADKIELLRHP